METKKCPDCGEEKPLERFGTYNPYYCKDCLNRRQKAHRRKRRAVYLAEHPKVVRTSKSCSMCGVDKPLEEFNFANKAKGVRSSYCKPCQGKRSYADQLRRGDPAREKLKYACTRRGTTLEWYDQTHAAQNGTCALCFRPETHAVLKGGKVRRLAIDHDHEHNHVRGLLCFRCNTALHQLELNGLDWAQRAVNYLQKFNPVGGG